MLTSDKICLVKQHNLTMLQDLIKEDTHIMSPFKYLED